MPKYEEYQSRETISALEDLLRLGPLFLRRELDGELHRQENLIDLVNNAISVPFSPNYLCPADYPRFKVNCLRGAL